METSTASLQRLIRVALSQRSLRGLSALIAVIAHSTGAPAAVLWELVEDSGGEGIPSVLACWPEGRPDGRPDEVTMTAFRTRDLALAPLAPTRSAQVVAAVPVNYLDGCHGVLSLYGQEPLPGEAFDVVADLLDVLPQLCSALRDRQALTLMQDCTAVLHEADLSSPRTPLDRDRLAAYFGQICDRIAADLRCRTVTLHLRESESDTFPLFAASAAVQSAEPVRRGEGPAGLAIEQGSPRAVPLPGAGGGPVLSTPVLSGEHVWGVICCADTHGSPHHFTQSDVSLLEPVGALITQYWSSWLDRRAVAAENLSWHRLAAGITAVNQLLAEQLGAEPPQHELVHAAALEIVREVLPGSASSELLRVDPQDTAAGAVVLARSGPEPVDPPPSWRVETRIRVRERQYGVLAASGPAAEAPANSAEVCQIMADQIGLYEHLDSTLRRLQRARQKLQDSLRGQAETLEDLEHQLVSPLLTATSRTEHVLRTGRFDKRTEQQLRAVRGLCRKASRVALSAGIFATLSRGQQPVPKPEPVGSDDVIRMLIAAADDAQVLGNPRRGIRFHVDRESVRTLGRQIVRTDRSFLEQSMGNLLDNAAKYSFQDTEVVIRCELSEDGFVVQVRNRGLTLEQDELERCLERNWRGRAARNATGEGSGLGLWIVSNLMRAQQAHVYVASADELTTVTLRLPLA